jgi:hypothetical protein
MKDTFPDIKICRNLCKALPCPLEPSKRGVRIILNILIRLNDIIKNSSPCYVIEANKIDFDFILFCVGCASWALDL